MSPTMEIGWPWAKKPGTPNSQAESTRHSANDIWATVGRGSAPSSGGDLSSGNSSRIAKPLSKKKKKMSRKFLEIDLFLFQSGTIPVTHFDKFFFYNLWNFLTPSRYIWGELPSLIYNWNHIFLKMNGMIKFRGNIWHFFQQWFSFNFNIYFTNRILKH